MSDTKTARCIFDVYDLRFGMGREAVSGLFTIDEEGKVTGEALESVNASNVLLFFDHNGRLWQVKAYYKIAGHEEAEALLEKMSQDYRFQTPQTRIAFELEEGEDEAGMSTLYVRYTELNYKREYIHHMMAVGAAKAAEEEEKARLIKEKEEEEYIPSGPLIF